MKLIMKMKNHVMFSSKSLCDIEKNKNKNKTKMLISADR